MRKLYILPVLMAALVSYKNPSLLVCSQVLLGSSLILYKGDRRLAAERSLTLLAGASFSAYTLVGASIAILTNRDGLSLRRSLRRSLSIRHAVLSAAAVFMLVSSQDSIHIPLVVWSLTSVFFMSERAVSLFWIPQIISSLAYAHLAGGISSGMLSCGVLSVLLVTPLRFVKKRDIKKR